MLDPSQQPVDLVNLSEVALAALGFALGAETAPELVPIVELGSRLKGDPRAVLPAAYAHRAQHPHPDDARLVRLSQSLGLSRIETLAAALTCAVDRNVVVGRALSALQHPLGGSRPTLGLLVGALNWLAEPGEDPMDLLAMGAAVQAGLLTLTPDDIPLAERVVAVPEHLSWALRGLGPSVAGVVVGVGPQSPQLAASLLAQARRHAHALMSRPYAALAIRCGSPAERRAAADAVCRSFGKRPLFLSRPNVIGLIPWLLLDDLLPVFECELGPSERFQVPVLLGYDGPCLVTAGPDGGIAARDGAPFTWVVPIPPPEERRWLWTAALGNEVLAKQLSEAHRHSCGRIAELSRLAKQRAAIDGREAPTSDDVMEAAWSSDASGLEALAEPVRAVIPSHSLVLGAKTQAELDLLLLRCRRREGLVDGLGVCSVTRYRPGVRALFVGASGSGKTLAVGWLASRLKMPLYRVDAASVVSKYIGETEKNLAQLLARAEDAEVVLLFDEADSLFGKRTDVKHSTDRFANAQTNYLLQRIESYDGIAILTSNSRARFDSAFTRRLDFIVEFPAPSAEERRRLWEVHLGTEHDLDSAQLNRLAASLDLVGGHIRNAVLSAAVLANSHDRRIGWSDIIRGVEAELRKLGKQVPPGLSDQSRRIKNTGVRL